MSLKLITFTLLLVLSTIGKSQSSYSGKLGSQPITLVMLHYSDGISRAHYSYQKYDTPITIDGKLKDGKLTLLEKDSQGNTKATLLFENFEENDYTINGKWIGSDSMNTLDIALNKDFSIGHGDQAINQTVELLQSKSTKQHYFKTIVSKQNQDFYAKITGVKVYEKGSDKLLQTIDLDCELLGINNVSIGDFNFDGKVDFSVFESSYSGPNTSRIYLLKDSLSNQYILSDFSGTSLEFDYDLKRIYEHNQCCAGRNIMKATYKVVDNTMVLVEQYCQEYDDSTEDFIQVDCD